MGLGIIVFVYKIPSHSTVAVPAFMTREKEYREGAQPNQKQKHGETGPSISVHPVVNTYNRRIAYGKEKQFLGTWLR